LARHKRPRGYIITAPFVISLNDPSALGFGPSEDKAIELSLNFCIHAESNPCPSSTGDAGELDALLMEHLSGYT